MLYLHELVNGKRVLRIVEITDSYIPLSVVNRQSYLKRQLKKVLGIKAAGVVLTVIEND